MTNLPPSGDSFSNYYDKYKQQFGRQQQSQPVNFSDYPDLFGAPKQELGFLGRLVDIVSRPLRIVSNPVAKALEMPEKYEALQREEAAGGEVSFGEKIAPVGNLIAAPFTGFFSDDPSNKPYWSDLIEKASDVVNRNDPGYVDVEDNVDPVKKGAYGFIGDVALDPLSWLPGVGFVKMGAKSASVYNKLGQVTGATAVGKAVGKTGKAIIEKIRKPKAPTTIEETAPLSFDATVFYGNRKEPVNLGSFNTAEEAQKAVEAAKAKSRSKNPWVEVGEGQRPAARANGFRITQRNTTLPKTFDEVDTGIKNNVPASAVGAAVVKSAEDAADSGLNATEATASVLNKIIQDQKLPDGTSLAGATTKFIAELYKPQFKTAAQVTKAKKEAQAAIEVPDFITWRRRTTEAINAGELENPAITVPDNGLWTAEERRVIRSARNLKRALEEQTNMRNSARVRQAIKLAITKNFYQPYIAQTKNGKAATFTGQLLNEDPMQTASVINQIDQVKETSVISKAAKAVYDKSREVWGKTKDAYIARNKKRLGLPTVKYDFANPVVSTRAEEMAQVYEELVSDPTNPLVREAYEALVKESREQYEYMTKELGIKVEFVDYDPYNIPGKNGQMVPDSKSMMEDVLNNKHLFVRSSAIDFAENPHPILSAEENDIFRAVHEFFGHAASGSNFRAAGEEGAWVSHSSMFSLKARRALTTETRGQNSYYNFRDPERKQFAPQKAALFPEEFVKLPTAAEVAASSQGAKALTLLEKFNRLSAEALAKAELLFGPKLLADLRAMNDTKLNLFFDDVQSILSGSGIAPIIGDFPKRGMRQELLKRFGLTADVVAQAQTKLNQKIDMLPVAPPKPVNEVANTPENLSEDLLFVDQFRRQMADDGFTSAGELDAAIAVIASSFNKSAWMLDEAEVLKRYPDVTANGKYRNNPEFGIGEGRNLGEANSHFIYTFARNAFKGVEELFEGVPARLKDGKIKTDNDGNTIYLKGKEPTFVDPKTGKPFMGEKLAERQGAYLINVYRGLETLLEKYGIPVVIDSAVDGTVFSMRISDILEGIRAGMMSNAEDLFGLSKEILDNEYNWFNLLFNTANTGVAYTKVMDAVAELIKNGDSATPDDVLKIITSNKRRNIREDGKEGTVDNWLASDNFEGLYGHNPLGKGQTIPKAPLGVRYEPNIKNGKTVGYHKYYEREVAAAKLADALYASRTAFKEISDFRSAERLADIDAEIGQIVPIVAENFMRMARTPEEAAAAIRAAANIGDMVKDVSRVVSAFDASVVASAGLVRNALGDRLANIAEYTTRLSDAAKKADTKAAAKARTKLMKETDEALKDVDEGAEKIVNTASDAADDAQTRALKDEIADEMQENATSASFRKEQSDGFASVQAGRASLLDPLNRRFNAKYGMNVKEFLWGWITYHGQGIMLREFVADRILSLRAINAKYGKMVDGKTSTLTRAWDLIRQGARPTAAEPEVLAAWTDLMRHGSKLFNTKPDAVDSLLGNVFFRSNAGIDYINDLLDQYRILGENVTPPGGIYINIDEARRTKKLTGKTLLEAAADQWRTWPVTDPIDFLSRLNAAASRMASDVAFVEKFIAKAKTEGLAVGTKTEGFVPLKPKGESRFGRLFQEEVYVRPEVAEIFKAIDDASQQSRGLNSEFGKFIRRTLDPITNTWKYAITLPRPGHHFRNLNGDLSFTFFAEGTREYARAAKDAFKVLSLRDDYNGISMVRALTGQGEVLPKQTTVISSGDYGQITAGQILEEAKKRGLMPPASVIEDLYDADVIAGGISRALEKGAAVASLGAAARGGRAEAIVTGISEARDHFARLQHMIQIIHKAQKGEYITRGVFRVVKPKNLDELFDVAAERVMKFHPDVSQLSAFETKYMRRLIPFYSWTRGAVLALGESMVMAPGRIQAVNKAAYNIAIAAGIDPNSLYDPFPDDQLFPSFLREEMQGPQFEVGGRYYGISPGIASWDVFNMLGPDPLRGVVGSTNPLLRAPIELLAGSSLGTGARIRDYSDYVDSNIPGVNYISSISGTSVTGSLASLLSGTGLDPQYQFAAGNKTAADQGISFLNYVTGIGLKDYSRPNYINYAEIELRNQAAEEANRNR